VRTIEQHIASMLRKAGAHGRGGLIARAYALGVLASGVWPPLWSGHRCLAGETPSRSAKAASANVPLEAELPETPAGGVSRR
jgi:hypothetical protein